MMRNASAGRRKRAEVMIKIEGSATPIIAMYTRVSRRHRLPDVIAPTKAASINNLYTYRFAGRIV